MSFILENVYEIDDCWNNIYTNELPEVYLARTIIFIFSICSFPVFYH